MPDTREQPRDASPDRRDRHRPAADGRGRTARHPLRIPWRGWKDVIGRVLRAVISDQISLSASGCAFWATLSLFPAISTVISLYGLLFDPQTVEPQLETIRHLLPESAFQLISAQVRVLVSHGSTRLGVSLFISTAITFWSAATGTKSLISALNIAYAEQERRGILRFQAVGLLLTLAAILFAILGIAIIVLLPAVISFLGLSAHTRGLVQLGSYAGLVIFVLSALSVLYRFGPSRRVAQWHWISPGSVVATVLWLLVSLAFTFYVQSFASYNATYGPLGTVAGIMLWFWATAYAVLFGAELNAELELQTAEDTTEDGNRPMGKRGAYVADHVAED